MESIALKFGLNKAKLEKILSTLSTKDWFTLCSFMEYTTSHQQKEATLQKVYGSDWNLLIAIEESGLSVRAINICKMLKAKTLLDVKHIGRKKFQHARGSGEKTVNEISKLFKEKGHIFQ